MYKEKTKHKQVNDPEYERKLIKTVMELKKTMRGVIGYAG